MQNKDKFLLVIFKKKIAEADSNPLDEEEEMR